MWLEEIKWSGVVACSSLYGALFLAVRYLIAVSGDGHAQLGLLLLILPGALAALMSKEAPLTVLLLAMMLASPPCLALMQLNVFHSMGLGQEIALISSAVFWCGSGTLGVMLWRTLADLHAQQLSKRG